ncbi:MAG: hypothetical protein AAGA76_12200 [Pseudomonadota bacterium]
MLSLEGWDRETLPFHSAGQEFQTRLSSEEQLVKSAVGHVKYISLINQSEEGAELGIHF